MPTSARPSYSLDAREARLVILTVNTGDENQLPTRTSNECTNNAWTIMCGPLMRGPIMYAPIMCVPIMRGPIMYAPIMCGP